jgi:hypothetical protein
LTHESQIVQSGTRPEAGLTSGSFKSETLEIVSIGVGIGIRVEFIKPIPVPTPKSHPESLNLNSDIAFTENPISFGIDTLKREVTTSPKWALL